MVVRSIREGVSQRLLGHGLQFGHHGQDPGLAGAERHLGEHLVSQGVRFLRRPVQQERDPVAHRRRQRRRSCGGSLRPRLSEARAIPSPLGLENSRACAGRRRPILSSVDR